MNLRKDVTLNTGRGSTRSLSVQGSLWKRLWTYRKTHYGTNECENDTVSCVVTSVGDVNSSCFC